MRPLLSIARLSLRRHAAAWAVGAGLAGLACAALAPADAPGGPAASARAALSYALALAEVLGVLAAAAVAAFGLRRDLEGGAANTYLARPLSGLGFLAGTWLGALGLAVGAVACLLSATLVGATARFGGPAVASVWPRAASRAAFVDRPGGATGLRPAPRTLAIETGDELLWTFRADAAGALGSHAKLTLAPQFALVDGVPASTRWHVWVQAHRAGEGPRARREAGLPPLAPRWRGEGVLEVPYRGRSSLSLDGLPLDGALEVTALLRIETDGAVAHLGDGGRGLVLEGGAAPRVAALGRAALGVAAGAGLAASIATTAALGVAALPAAGVGVALAVAARAQGVLTREGGSGSARSGEADRDAQADAHDHAHGAKAAPAWVVALERGVSAIAHGLPDLAAADALPAFAGGELPVGARWGAAVLHAGLLAALLLLAGAGLLRLRGPGAWR